MLISELNFDHLRAEHEAWLARELEQRRVVEERRAETTPAIGATGRRVRWSAVLRMLQIPPRTRTPRPSRGPGDRGPRGPARASAAGGPPPINCHAVGRAAPPGRLTPAASASTLNA